MRTGRRRPFVTHLGYRWSDKLVFKLEPECDGSYPYMKIGRVLKEDVLVRVTTTAEGRKLIGGGHFVCHLGYSLSDKTHILT